MPISRQAPAPLLVPAPSTHGAAKKVKKPLPTPRPLCTTETCRVKACVNHDSNRQPASLIKQLGPGELFEDREFPGPRLPSEADFTSWLRPAEFCPGTPMLFVRGAEPSDVIQGELGNCWFISSMAVLATRKEYLKRLFVLPGRKEVEFALRGLYAVAIYKDEYWHRVVIDDRVLCYRYNTKPVYARCHDPNELWVSLLEKAYAKVHGGYEVLVSGFVDYGLKDLTGGVPEVVNFRTPAGQRDLEADLTWPRLLELHRGGCLMGAASCSNENGIVNGHAYSILDMREVTTVTGQRARLVSLRNPL
eukprot:tig00000042_g15511.t1